MKVPVRSLVLGLLAFCDLPRLPSLTGKFGPLLIFLFKINTDQVICAVWGMDTLLGVVAHVASCSRAAAA